MQQPRLEPLTTLGINYIHLICSPEIWEETPYNEKSDIWSLGVLIYELVTLTLPFNGEDIVSLSNNICKAKYEPIPTQFSAELATLISVLL